MADYRTERDSMGDMQVPAGALYGASTARAAANFPISGRRCPRSLIQALGWIKQVAATTNAELGVLDDARATLIAEAAAEVADGRFDDEFVVDVYQTGSGTSTNMNANEVIAHLANLHAPETVRIHPNDHVNAGQSSNDVFPTAVHLAVKGDLEKRLVPTLYQLAAALTEKQNEFRNIIKSGRTHLQDAVPITLGQEFAAYAWQTTEGIRRLQRAAAELGALALGGTAVGTGVNTHPDFARKAIARLAQASGLALQETENHAAAQALPDALVDASAALRSVALSLMKIANDIRFLASGPVAGLGELRLPAVQPGSSIMPGKINPVIAEALLMVCATVIGNDATVATAAQWSHFELHTMWPLLADRLLDSITLLTNAVQNFTLRLVTGIEANPERCEELLLKNSAVATVLAPALGYDKVAEWVKRATETGEQVLHKVEGRDDVYRIGDQIVPKSWLTESHA